MASSFLDALSHIYHPSSGTLVTYGGAAALALLAYLIYSTVVPNDKGSIRTLGGFPVLTAWAFFTRRYDFLWGNFQKHAAPHFKFSVLHHQVVALRGEEARQAFFNSKSLNFTEGYKILLGASPSLKDINIQSSGEGGAWFNKQVALLFTNKQRLTENIPALLEDINRRMESWGREGQIDPFKSIYDLVFQMTVRMASCDELANDEQELEKIQELYWILEKSATPTAVLLPWFPGPAKKAKEVATRQLYMKLSHYVDIRRVSKVPTNNAIDILIGQGRSNPDIIAFILGVIFAGVINTGIQSCWALLFLGTSPEWRAKVQAEVASIIEKHTNTTSREPLHKRLASVPASIWEDEMPVMDLVIRETLRVIFTSTLLRRNVVEDITVSGGVIKPGDFIAYNVDDAHRNPDIYTDADRFDPGRFLPGREEDKKAAFAFLGWGVGRHPCTGMKIAKLEIKLIVAMMLAAFDYDVVDSSGRPSKNLPEHDRNDIHQARPVGEPVYLKFKRVVE
ncbi:hypothetical protein HYPSUDRAFT_813626 [Hypholoma sublateritium FD-334 SS-4]|uniref:Cytochrome P450 n=1 Tax=Hypholoma sublateritium (strain FD-334 SS-4) TaxID=945553 RepID=A0A0D2MAP8_HYPSF|nr:hypothetical protein HYPSUDRAFT_813626 [Hypholoma sublateritium FD-334 SS-4]